MGVVNYYGTDGEILGDSASGDYMRDALGSVTGTTSPTNATVQNSYRYKPYGEKLSKTGASTDPKFQWVGTVGYRQTAISHSASYVRARHYAKEEARWTTVDPIWPTQKAFGYVNGKPIHSVDPSGHMPRIDTGRCKKPMGQDFWNMQLCLAKLCLLLKEPGILDRILACVARHGNNEMDTSGMGKCLSSFCGNSDNPAHTGRITCGACEMDEVIRCDVYDPCRGRVTREFNVPPCAEAACLPGKFDPSGQITICEFWYQGLYQELCPYGLAGGGEPTCGDIGTTILHELLHNCTGCNGVPNHHPSFDRVADCIRGVINC